MGKIEQWARWTFWPACILTVAAIAMLLTGMSERTWQWFLPVYLLIGTPTVIQDFTTDLRRLKSLWRSRNGGEDDTF